MLELDFDETTLHNKAKIRPKLTGLVDCDQKSHKIRWLQSMKICKPKWALQCHASSALKF